MPRPLCHLTSVVQSRSLGLVVSYDKLGVLKAYSDQDDHGTLSKHVMRIKLKITFIVPRFDKENTLAVLPYTELLEKVSS